MKILGFVIAVCLMMVGILAVEPVSSPGLSTPEQTAFLLKVPTFNSLALRDNAMETHVVKLASSAYAAQEKEWTKGGKIMTVGLGKAGALVRMMIKGGETDLDGTTALDWRTTGALWTAGGSALAIIGLTRRR